MSKTILIVDDSESIRELLVFTLKKSGYDVLSGCDGKDALKYLDGRNVDFMITDYHMPNIDGISLIKEVRSLKDYRYIPILLLTTETHQNRKMEAKEAGATGWIIKPFDEGKLLSAIKKVMR